MNVSRTLYKRAAQDYDVVYAHDVVYARRETGNLKLQLFCPIDPVQKPQRGPMTPVQQKFAAWRKDPEVQPEKKEDPRFPLIVDVPGSGWSGSDGYRHVPYMVSLARQGFVAACIAYRGTYKDDVVFPAAVQDTREAIRYLRAHAEEFHIDPDRVGLMGDSSGGNTASMAALVEDGTPSFDIGAHLDQTTSVKACCNVYGPVDLVNLLEDRIREGKRLRPGEAEEGLPFESMEIWQERYKEDPKRFLRAASPIEKIVSGKKLPPFLFIQGDEDAIIPEAQGLRFCEKLRDHGGRAEYVKIAGAGHGSDCWSTEMIDLVASFFKAYL